MFPVATYYRRMFAGLNHPPPQDAADREAGCTKLGQAMIDRDPALERESQPHLATAGYTYLGQFIDHDLTLDNTPLDHATADVERVPNFRTPFLDLDHVYGGGPSLSPFLYRQGNRMAERFLIGQTSGEGSNFDDLPRNSEGTALVTDPRQDENLLIAQLHVAFLKLHNIVVTDAVHIGASPHYRRIGASDFTAARRLLTWHYQWIIRHDFLRRVLDPAVFGQLGAIENERRAAPADSSIPVEFNVAAFRFGHSLVRDCYKTGVNQSRKPVNLADLLHRTGSLGGAAPALPADWVVSWDQFFEFRGGRVGALNRVRKIDTQIANGLHHLDEPIRRLFVATSPASIPQPQLPVRTLLRGLRMQLPSGEDVAREITRSADGMRVLTNEEILRGPHQEILNDPQNGLRQNTPLWYYILKEAEALTDGSHLGPVGSYIVAQVIVGALVNDPDSYLAAPDWRPTLFHAPAEDGESPQMGMLLQFIERNYSRRHWS